MVSRIAGVIGITEGRGPAAPDARRRAAAAAVAAGPGQLRAPARRVRPGRPGPAGQRAGAAAAEHQPGTAVGRGRDDVLAGPPLTVARRARTLRSAKTRTAMRASAVRRPGRGLPRPGFTLGPDNVPAVTAICRALDRHAAGDRAGRGQGPGAVGGADQRPPGRTGGAHRGRPVGRASPGTLRPAIEWSYELPTAPERTLSGGYRCSPAGRWSGRAGLLRRGHPGHRGARPDRCAGGQVAGRTRPGEARPGAVPDARHDQGIAEMRLAQAGESAAVRLRLRDYTLRTAEQNLMIGMARVPAPWSTRVDVFRRYDVDAGNVTQVLNWCLEAGDAEAGLRICAAVSPCWIVWGTFGEGGEWLRSLLALDMTAVPAWVQGAAMVRVPWSDTRRGGGRHPDRRRHHGRGPWVSPPDSSSPAGSCRCGGRSVRLRDWRGDLQPSPRSGCRPRPAGAWTAGSRSATTAARSATSSPTGTTSSTATSGSRRSSACTPPTTSRSSPAACARHPASRRACSASTPIR